MVRLLDLDARNGFGSQRGMERRQTRPKSLGEVNVQGAMWLRAKWKRLAVVVIFGLIIFARFRQEHLYVTSPSDELLPPMSSEPPVVLEVEPCQGFSEQQLQLVKAVIVGNTLGAHVILPTTSKSDLWQLLDTQSLFQTVNKLFRKSWCASPPDIVRRFWCGQFPVDSVTILSRSELNLRHGHRKISKIEDLTEFQTLRQQLWDNTPARATVNCSVLLHMPVVEPSFRWYLFWNISQSIIFSQSVEDTVSRISKMMPKYAALAAKKGSDMGYRYPTDSSQFNVLHLRAEPDWEQFCKFGYVAAGLFILVVSNVFLC